MRVLTKKPKIVFQEVPGELSLVFSAVGCGGPCKGCHSPELHDITAGVELDFRGYVNEITKYKGKATCVLFLGGDWFNGFQWYIDGAKYLGFKAALYTHKYETKVHYLDYLKTGPYIKELGGLQSETTNQRFFKGESGVWQLLDLTKSK